MQIKDFLNSVCEQIKYKPIRENISEELKCHIEELKEEYIRQGIKEDEAENKAVEQMGNSEEIGKKLNKIHRQKLDWKLILIAVILLFFGCLVVMIRAKGFDAETYGIKTVSIKKFITFIIIGLILSIMIYLFDYRKINKYSNILYILATILIIWTLNFGALINGIPHFRLGFLGSLSVDTIAIPIYIISFVGFLSNMNKENKFQEILSGMNINVNANLLKIILLSIISLILLSMIPALSSAFILGMIYLVLATINILKTGEDKKAGLIKLWGVPIILGIILLFIIYTESPYRFERLALSFNPEKDPEGGGWIGINQKIVINSAQTLGEAQDMSNAITLFDEGTDFAFISILAHYGWIVGMVMVLTIILMSIKLIINSIKVKDCYGKLLVIGISSMFIMQSVFNVLMNLNLGIKAHFNIPFVSYGGANLIINMISLALILSVYRKKDVILEESNNDVKNFN